MFACLIFAFIPHDTTWFVMLNVSNVATFAILASAVVRLRHHRLFADSFSVLFDFSVLEPVETELVETTESV